MVGLNHGCWGVEQDYDGADPMPLLAEAWERRRDDPTLDRVQRRQLQLAVAMGSIPADYFQYYYFTDEVLAEYRAKPTTRAEDILSWSGDYWRHYEEQARTDDPQLDPAPLTRRHSRARARDRRDGRDLQRQGRDPPRQHAERGRRAAGLPGGPRRRGARPLQRRGIEVLPAKPLPRHVRGLVEMLGEYQALAAETAWNGTRRDGIRALSANPLVREIELAETLYDALATAHRDYLPERLQAA